MENCLLIFQSMKFDESGNQPVLIKPEEVEKKNL